MGPRSVSYLPRGVAGRGSAQSRRRGQELSERYVDAAVTNWVRLRNPCFHGHVVTDNQIGPVNQPYVCYFPFPEYVFIVQTPSLLLPIRKLTQRRTNRAFSFRLNLIAGVLKQSEMLKKVLLPKARNVS